MMDRHTCKLCFRRFSNGRALGGHMRSHVTFGNNTTSKPQLQDTASPSSSASASHRQPEAPQQVAEVADQAAAALMADREVAARVEEAKQLAYYGLRENPRKSYRLVDPEFSSTFPAVDYAAAAAAAAAGFSVVLQDRESETESSKPPSLRRRSKRRRRTSPLPVTKSEPSIEPEPEPVSSISDATPEEDVARCLMMLSRDAWENTSSPAAKSKRSNREEVEEEEEEEEEEQNSDDDSEEELIAIVRSRRGGRSRYQCDTCRKVFRSYQALGGHRASHKKVRVCTVAPPAVTPASVVVEKGDDVHPHLDNTIQDADSEVNAAPSTGSTARRIHECPVCFRTFGSGQALGGHKRSHPAYSSTIGSHSLVVVTGAAAAPGVAATTTTASAAASAVFPADANRAGKLVGERLIDLNLPPPMDEEVEMSAVCDAEH